VQYLSKVELCWRIRRKSNVGKLKVDDFINKL